MGAGGWEAGREEGAAGDGQAWRADLGRHPPRHTVLRPAEGARQEWRDPELFQRQVTLTVPFSGNMRDIKLL